MSARWWAVPQSTNGAPRTAASPSTDGMAGSPHEYRLQVQRHLASEYDIVNDMGVVRRNTAKLHSGKNRVIKDSRTGIPAEYLLQQYCRVQPAAAVPATHPASCLAPISETVQRVRQKQTGKKCVRSPSAGRGRLAGAHGALTAMPCPDILCPDMAWLAAVPAAAMCWLWSCPMAAWSCPMAAWSCPMAAWSCPGSPEEGEGGQRQQSAGCAH